MTAAFRRSRAVSALAWAIFALGAVLRPEAAAAQAPRVVVSILPVHSLVAAVMAGVGEPRLLIRGGGSPHDASLRPSGARSLAAADLVVWIGPGLETFLEKPLSALAGGARVIGLVEALARDGGGPAQAAPLAVNPHLWLDPQNAARIARLTAAALGELDPGNAAGYRANAVRLEARLDALDRELRGRLAPVAGVPYLVFHDAYAYFEARYGLNVVGAFTVNPALPPGARRLVEMRARIAALGVTCVFAEPQFRPALVEAVIAGTAARAGTLDPLGVEIAPGAAAYFELMRALADDLVACLSRSQ